MIPLILLVLTDKPYLTDDALRLLVEKAEGRIAARSLPTVLRDMRKAGQIEEILLPGPDYVVAYRKLTCKT